MVDKRTHSWWQTADLQFWFDLLGGLFMWLCLAVVFVLAVLGCGVVVYKALHG